MKSQYRQKFYDLYLKEILPLFMDYETEQKKQKSILIYIFITVTLILTGCTFFWIYNTNYSGDDLYLFLVNIIAIACICSYFILPQYFNKKFKRKLKEICEPTFEKCFNNLVWNKTGTSFKDIFERSNLFGYFNIESYDDIFTITHEGVKIEVIETHLQDKQGSGKNQRIYNVFKGVVIIFPSNKEIKAHTIITSKEDSNIRNTRIGFGVSTIGLISMLIFSFFINDTEGIVAYSIGLLTLAVAYKLITNKKLKEVNLEDVEFDKRFQVASEDQVEARYLVTPAFMDRLKGLQTGFGTEKIKCAFFEDKIMFAISTNEDLFEVGDLFVPLSNSKQMTKFFNEITSILEMVDYFKLDQKIGL